MARLAQGAASMTTTPFTHVYAWRNNERRAALYGRRCRIVAAGRMGTVLVEFENGERVTTSHRALRRARP
jgi:hypothetical protein